MDHIESAFAGVTVEDFLRDTSAVWTQRFADLQPHDRRRVRPTGEQNFNEWVEVMLEVTREAAASPLGFHPIAMIHSQEQQRRFAPDEDDTVPSFAQRLGRESRAMNGTWLFVAVESQGRVYPVDEEPPPPVDASDVTEIQHALDAGTLQAGICWVASIREPGVSADRGGIMYLGSEGVTGEDEGELDTSTNVFQAVLEDK